MSWKKSIVLSRVWTREPWISRRAYEIRTTILVLEILSLDLWRGGRTLLRAWIMSCRLFICFAKHSLMRDVVTEIIRQTDHYVTPLSVHTTNLQVGLRLHQALSLQWHCRFLQTFRITKRDICLGHFPSSKSSSMSFKGNRYLRIFRNLLFFLFLQLLHAEVQIIKTLVIVTKIVTANIQKYFFFGVHGTMKCGQKTLMLVWGCHQLLSEFLAKGHLPRVSRQSRLSANVKGDNELILGLDTDLLEFALRLRKTPDNLY